MVRRRQADDVHDQRRGVVMAAGLQRAFDNTSRALFRRGAFVENGLQAPVGERAVNAVAAQQVTVVRPQFVARVIGAHRVLQPDRAIQHVAHVGMRMGMVEREPLQAVVAQAVDARIADVHHMRLAPAQDQRRERRRHRRPRRIALPLGMHPAVHGGQRPRRRAVDTERGRQTQIAVNEPAHGGLGGKPSAGTAAHAVGNHRERVAQRRAVTVTGSDVIVVGRTPAGFGGESDTGLERVRCHQVTSFK